MKERWKLFADGDYEVSDHGRVRRVTDGVNTKAGRMKTPTKNKGGYMIVATFKNSRGKNHTVHALVAETFLGPRPEGYQVNHKDGDKTNNLLTNLEYVTPTENMAHASRLGLLATGERSGRRTHPEKIRRGADHWTRFHPDRVARGDQNGSRVHPERLKRGEEQSNSKLTDKAVREIRRLYAKGHSCSDLGRMFCVSSQNIGFVVRRDTWRHVA